MYLSLILDLYNGVIANETNKRPVFDMVLKTVEKALKKNGENDRLLLHSDQGWHYRMERYRELLRENKIIQSRSRKLF